MNIDNQTPVKSVLDELEDLGYRHLNRLCEKWQSRVYFTDSGKARLGMIAGYIIGLKHAGKVELAEKMAENIFENIQRLSMPHQDVVVESRENKFLDEDGQEQTETKTIRVPGSKCIVGDDGTWHGFSLMWYRLLPSEVYEERLAEHQASINEERKSCEVYDTAHQRTVKALQIRERVDHTVPYSSELTEYRFLSEGNAKFYYVPGYNGGLIYHGPGSGQTFTTNFNGNTLWGIHT